MVLRQLYWAAHVGQTNPVFARGGCLVRNDASTDMQQHLGLSHDIDLIANVDVTFQGRHACVPAYLHERSTMASELCR